MIRHIVMWKFREGEAENREKFLSGLQALDGVIPEIRHMEIHRSCKPGNPYDACLIADFDDLDALSRYKNDPRHVANRAARSTTSCKPSISIYRFRRELHEDQTYSEAAGFLRPR